jgi:anti-sigma factor RsiW
MTHESETDCDRARIALMALIDGEHDAAGEAVAEAHLATCPDCREWQRQFQMMTGRLEGSRYPDAGADAWPGIAERLPRATAGPQLYVIGALILVWRAVDLLVDLPLSADVLIPVAAFGAVLWVLARNPIAIETFAPELQKRGVR